MSNFYRTDLLVLDVTKGIYDMYLTVLSPVLGKVHVIAKHASSSKSKRKVQLKKGNVLNAIIFNKNRYYLSDFAVKQSLFLNLESVDEVKLLELWLKIIEGFSLYADFKEFKYILFLLEHTFLHKKIKHNVGTIYFLNMYNILPFKAVCSSCKKTKLSGVVTKESVWLCNDCYNADKNKGKNREKNRDKLSGNKSVEHMLADNKPADNKSANFKSADSKSADVYLALDFTSLSLTVNSLKEIVNSMLK